MIFMRQLSNCQYFLWLDISKLLFFKLKVLSFFKIVNTTKLFILIMLLTSFALGATTIKT